jgi:hypothetical protein
LSAIAAVGASSAAWREEERKASRTARVRVEMRQLKQWYRTLDQLLACKPQCASGGFGPQ